MLSVIIQFGVQTAGVFTHDMKHTIGDFVTKFHMEYATGYYPYLLIGWYLTAFPPTKKVRMALELVGLLSLIGMVLVVQFFIHDIPHIRDYMVEMNTLPAMLYGVGVFTLITGHLKERETRSKAVAMLSKHSFGVYITHVWVLDILLGVVLPYTVFHEQYPLLYTPTTFALGFGASLLLTIGLSKIPGVKKLVRG